MTIKERDILDQLRGSIHDYVIEVRTHMARCESCTKQVAQLVTDVYGNPEDREGNPGLMHQVDSLRKGRKVLLGVVAGAWTMATMLLGTFVSRWF